MVNKQCLGLRSKPLRSFLNVRKEPKEAVANFSKVTKKYRL